jgi:hypothetical protein
MSNMSARHDFRWCPNLRKLLKFVMLLVVLWFPWTWPRAPRDWSHDAYGYIYGLAAWFFFCASQYMLIIRRDWRWWWRLSGGLGCIGLGIVFSIHCADHLFDLDEISVTQKFCLTTPNYCNTVLFIGRAQMANVLPMDKQVAVISALAEGSGIRQIERITGVHRDTIMRLGVRVGHGCAELLDSKMRNLSCRQLQFDEIWGFIGKKERRVRPDDNPHLGFVNTRNRNGSRRVCKHSL